MAPAKTIGQTSHTVAAFTAVDTQAKKLEKPNIAEYMVLTLLQN